jgi:glyceraldehyde 3-phosphate dehydrogenase
MPVGEFMSRKSDASVKVGINGLGRVGRNVLRRLWETRRHTCVHINDLNRDIENIAYLILHDSVLGRFPGQVRVSGARQITLESGRERWQIQFSNQPVIKNVDWSGVDCVIDSSGVEANALAARDLSGPGHVIVTHSFAEADITLVFGVNEELFDSSRHRVISSSICDAIAIAPVLKVISDQCGVDHVFVTTMHPWLSYQNIMDGPVRSETNPNSNYTYYPLGRASVGALIPKPTTVGKVLEFVVPSLRNRVLSFSYRVPTAVVASADISLVTSCPVDTRRIEAMLLSLNERVVRCSNEMLISVDYEGETASAVVDQRWLEVRDERYVKMVLWYDNEFGYSSRVVDILDLICK